MKLEISMFGLVAYLLVLECCLLYSERKNVATVEKQIRAVSFTIAVMFGVDFETLLETLLKLVSWYLLVVDSRQCLWTKFIPVHGERKSGQRLSVWSWPFNLVLHDLEVRMDGTDLQEWCDWASGSIWTNHGAIWVILERSLHDISWRWDRTKKHLRLVPVSLFTQLRDSCGIRSFSETPAVQSLPVFMWFSFHTASWWCLQALTQLNSNKTRETSNIFRSWVASGNKWPESLYYRCGETENCLYNWRFMDKVCVHGRYYMS